MLDLKKRKLNIQFFAEGDPAPEPPKPDDDIMIPKHRFDEVSKKAKEMEERIKELEGKLDVLPEKDKKVKELEQQLEAVKKEYEEEKTLKEKTSIIKSKIGDKVVDFELVLSLLKLEDIKVNAEGKISGLGAQVKELQKAKPYLWKTATVVVKPGSGNPPKPEKTFAQKLAEKKKVQNAIVGKGRNYF